MFIIIFSSFFLNVIFSKKLSLYVCVSNSSLIIKLALIDIHMEKKSKYWFDEVDSSPYIYKWKLMYLQV